MPKVSVVIPVYNCAKYVSEAIESVLAQTYKDYEIIVIDDGSTDNTREVLEPYIEKGLIRYVWQENKGVSAARNRGIEEAKGEYVIFLDGDDFLLPNALSVRITFMDKYNLKFSFGDYFVLKREEEKKSFIQPNLAREGYYNRFNPLFNDVEIMIVSKIELVKKNLLFLKAWTGAVTVNLTWWKDNVYRFFDERFRKAEDMEMWWYLLLRDDVDKIGIIKVPTVVYRFYNNSWTKDSMLVYYDYMRFKRLFLVLKRKKLLDKVTLDNLFYSAAWAFFSGSCYYRMKFFLWGSFYVSCIDLKFLKGVLGALKQCLLQK